MSDDVELSASRSCLFVRAEWGEIEHFSMNLLMTKRSVVEEVMNIHFSCTAFEISINYFHARNFSLSLRAL